MGPLSLSKGFFPRGVRFPASVLQLRRCEARSVFIVRYRVARSISQLESDNHGKYAIRRRAESVELQESGAENLHLAQPSLTRQIKHLEAEIGVFRFGHGIMRKCN